jgi:VPDSG-CTERM motif
VANGSTVTVISDNPLDPLHTYPTEANGQTYTYPVSGGNTATFTDNGDSVPDGGTTIGLLGLALIGIFAFGRKPAASAA